MSKKTIKIFVAEVGDTHSDSNGLWEGEIETRLVKAQEGTAYWINDDESECVHYFEVDDENTIIENDNLMIAYSRDKAVVDALKSKMMLKYHFDILRKAALKTTKSLDIIHTELLNLKVL